MTNSLGFKAGYAEARRQADIKQQYGKQLKAFKRTAPSAQTVTIKVAGQKALERHLDAGWEFLTQDVSLHGQWVRQYILRRNKESLRLDLVAVGLL